MHEHIDLPNRLPRPRNLDAGTFQALWNERVPQVVKANREEVLRIREWLGIPAPLPPAS